MKKLAKSKRKTCKMCWKCLRHHQKQKLGVHGKRNLSFITPTGWQARPGLRNYSLTNCSKTSTRQKISFQTHQRRVSRIKGDSTNSAIWLKLMCSMDSISILSGVFLTCSRVCLQVGFKVIMETAVVTGINQYWMTALTILLTKDLTMGLELRVFSI